MNDLGLQLENQGGCGNVYGKSHLKTGCIGEIVWKHNTIETF